MKLHHYLWVVAAACMLLPGCSNEDLSDHAAAPVFIPGNSEVEIRFAAHSDEVSTSVDKHSGRRRQSGRNGGVLSRTWETGEKRWRTRYFVVRP